MDMGYVYKITNQMNGLKYVGQTVDPTKRWRDHRLASRSPKRYGSKSIHFAMCKHGIENFIFEILEECSDDILDQRERYWIKEFNTNRVAGGRGYNLTEGGRGAGMWREAASLAQRGERSSWWGRHHTKATKEKQRLAHLGRKFTKEHKHNISLGKKGQVRRQTLEERAQRKRTMQHYMHPVVQCDLNGIQIARFTSIKQACEWLKANGFPKAGSSGIRRCLNGHGKTSNGFIWRDGR